MEGRQKEVILNRKHFLKVTVCESFCVGKHLCLNMGPLVLANLLISSLWLAAAGARGVLAQQSGEGKLICREGSSGQADEGVWAVLCPHFVPALCSGNALVQSVSDPGAFMSSSWACRRWPSP